jgi:hypothetical protein
MLRVDFEIVLVTHATKIFSPLRAKKKGGVDISRKITGYVGKTAKSGCNS